MIDREEAYAVIAEFVEALKDNDVPTLTGRFGLPAAVLEEIVEVLSDYFSDGYPALGIAPLDLAFNGSKGRPNIEIFQMNDAEHWGVECILWKDGAPAEPILHVELDTSHEAVVLSYKYIGS